MTTLSQHIEKNHSEGCTCAQCGEPYELRQHATDSGFCDSCSHAMVPDALRYQWLTTQENFDHTPPPMRAVRLGWYSRLTKEKCDAAIDEAGARELPAR